VKMPCRGKGMRMDANHGCVALGAWTSVWKKFVFELPLRQMTRVTADGDLS
jgi:hypothetical protein